MGQIMLCSTGTNYIDQGHIHLQFYHLSINILSILSFSRPQILNFSYTFDLFSPL